MKILALEPYYGGSHQAFLDGWTKRSRHDWTLLTQPPHTWKWRMRSSAIVFARQVSSLMLQGHTWDAVFCSNMLNLAEFLGLVRSALPHIPAVAYFHENQLTYPSRFESERDLHFTMINVSTGLAANNVWFNSAFHRDQFLAALKDFLKRMPGHELTNVPQRLRERSAVFPPGIDIRTEKPKRKPGPVSILWAARWEHDKNPEDFFEALKRIKQQGIDFRLAVIGERFKDSPPVFDRAKGFFAENIDCWGYQETRRDYEKALSEADLIVSTAHHEFFGITVLEAIAAGCYPVLPKRLSYPEVLAGIETVSDDEFLYDGTVKGLAAKLLQLAPLAEAGKLWGADEKRGVRAVQRFSWAQLAERMDKALTKW